MTKWDSETHNFTIKHIKGKELLVLVYKEVGKVEKQSKTTWLRTVIKELEKKNIANDNVQWRSMIVVMRPSRDKEDK